MRVVSITAKGLPTLYGEPWEISELFEMMFGDDGPKDGQHVTVKFQDMDEDAFNNLSDWDP